MTGGDVKAAFVITPLAAATIGLLGIAVSAQVPAHRRAAELQKWAIHDETRPMPPVVDPGPAGPPAPVPADAIVLFDGRDLSGWTYADGMAAALYGQFPPLVNASRKPGEWQTYDIVFHAPRFGDGGALLSPARATVFHNGILVQDNEELTGPTAHKARPPYKVHASKLPLSLQDHNHPVRFRNIWIRELQP
jgi:hypothetical protein